MMTHGARSPLCCAALVAAVSFAGWAEAQQHEAQPPATKRNDASLPPASIDEMRGVPPRPPSAIGGRQFVQGLAGLSLEEREAAILREIVAGNVPDFLRQFSSVDVPGRIKDRHGDRRAMASLKVMPDYLSVGSDADFVRLPMTPQTAQRIADRFGCVLPTPMIVDAIDAQAEVRLPPHPLTRARESVDTFLEHHRIIERQRTGQPLSRLLTGIKKDIVLSPRLVEQPDRLAIYGWRRLDGRPIQPLSIVHSNRYVDYSHGVRLVSDRVEIDGVSAMITELLADPDRCGMVSDEGPMNPPRYPLEEDIAQRR